VGSDPNRGAGLRDQFLAVVYPADSARGATFSTSSRRDIERTYRAALRHSWHVRWLRFGVPIGIAAALLAVIIANYLPSLGAIRLPGEFGKLVIKGTKITMQQPKISGFTSDGRPYDFTAVSAAQDITKPDFLELQKIHARMQLADKSTVEITAPRGTYDLKAEILTLNDDVAFVSSTGYAARLTIAVIDTRKGDVVSEQPVWVKLLNGFLNAKRLDIVDNGDVLRFSGGVSMTLHPDKESDPVVQP
jgi:lipopolysaccharide export system protein LptC